MLGKQRSHLSQTWGLGDTLLLRISEVSSSNQVGTEVVREPLGHREQNGNGVGMRKIAVLVGNGACRGQGECWEVKAGKVLKGYVCHVRGEEGFG